MKVTVFEKAFGQRLRYDSRSQNAYLHVDPCFFIAVYESPSRIIAMQAQ